MTAMGYEVISFAYDDIAHRPELCKTLLQMVMSRYQAVSVPEKMTDLAEKEAVRLAFTLARPCVPSMPSDSLAFPIGTPFKC